MQLRSEIHVRRRRKPERGALHQVLLAHVETFLERARAPDSGHRLPRFVERELRSYLECGLLAHGFARVHCSRCLRDELVAFSCKGRGFCPSCCGRRMADTAAHLVDHVLPHAPVRQWVLSFPFRIRFLLASSPRLCAAVRGIVTRTLLGWLEQRALAGAAEGLARSRSSECEPTARREPAFAARSGAVLFAQRFCSALNLNLHFHALVLDGAFVSPASVRRRRPHLPALRRPTPPHSAAHRPSRRARDPRPPRTAHRAPTARTGPLARTARLRLSRPHPHAAEHAPRPQPAPASRPAPFPSARSTARARVGRLASTRSTASASLGEPLDGTDCRDEPPPRGR